MSIPTWILQNLKGCHGPKEVAHSPFLVMQLWVGSCMGLHLLSCLQAPCLTRTQHWKSVSTVSGVRPVMSHGLILHVPAQRASPWPSQASIASNLFFEAWFPLKWMAMLSVFLATTFNCSSNSLSSPWNTFLWLWNWRSPVCVYLVMYTYAYTYVCIYIYV